MSHKDVFNCLNAVVPTAHVCFPPEAPHPCPFVVYYRERLRGQCADDALYAPVSEWVVELHQQYRDNDLEAAIEAAITEQFGIYKITGETWREDDQHFITVYGFSALN